MEYNTPDFSEEEKVQEPVPEKEEPEEIGLPAQETVSPRKKVPKKKGVLKNILSWVITIVAAFLAAVLINTYIFRTSMINGASMYPTLQEEQVVVLSELPYIFGDMKAGDVIVFDSHCFNDGYEPNNFLDNIKDSLKYNVITQKLFGSGMAEERYWVKRIIGLPGDVIEFRENVLYVNGEEQKESYINNPDNVDYITGNRYANSTVTVEEGYLFVMGDNRNRSKDSRMMGPVPINSIVGKVLTGV